MLPEEESRPGRGLPGAAGTSTPAKIEPIVRQGCPVCLQWRPQCPEHGCPWCRCDLYRLCVEDLDELTPEELADHLEEFDPVEDCPTCRQLLDWCPSPRDHGPSRCRAHGCVGCWTEDHGQEPCEGCQVADLQLGLAEFPGWECELEGCLHCASCNACKGTGRVCRNCRLCVDCAAVTEPGTCLHQRWDRLTRSLRAFLVHSLWDPSTGRWAE